MILFSSAFIISALLPAVILIFSLLISYHRIETHEKSSVYECGFDPVSSARLPFSLRFFLLAVIFLVFDIEIVLLMSSPLTIKIINSPLILVTLIAFIYILILGLIHEWNEGSLAWTY